MGWIMPEWTGKREELAEHISLYPDGFGTWREASVAWG
jgi:hypothetical protein